VNGGGGGHNSVVTGRETAGDRSETMGAMVWARMWHAGPVTGWGWALGGFRLAAWYCCNGPVLVQYPNNFFTFKVAQYETGTSTTPKICNLGIVLDKFKRNNFTFGKKFKFPTEFELKI
jgi:hypothetical protein